VQAHDARLRARAVRVVRHEADRPARQRHHSSSLVEPRRVRRSIPTAGACYTCGSASPPRARSDPTQDSSARTRGRASPWTAVQTARHRAGHAPSDDLPVTWSARALRSLASSLAAYAPCWSTQRCVQLERADSKPCCVPAPGWPTEPQHQSEVVARTGPMRRRLSGPAGVCVREGRIGWQAWQPHAPSVPPMRAWRVP
jgi:hypothetical protein